MIKVSENISRNTINQNKMMGLIKLRNITNENRSFDFFCVVSLKRLVVRGVMIGGRKTASPTYGRKDKVTHLLEARLRESQWNFTR